ncbi:MAG TPA: DUF2693 domain-containing protein [Candidatus Limisoma intestinavium]|uniref:DUF2693 domain-containing protein n=1 Tax=Candidatus Limisoma intestinavium TaxID=2840856 RepID=A0A9D1ILY6_9BACT|nr:DUF2693 domain-containing protein [Candidatus Limisoma intestinavium]
MQSSPILLLLWFRSSLLCVGWGQTVSLIQETTLCALQGKKVVEFYFKKTEGTLRQAFGTLMRSRVPETKGVKKKRPAINRLSAVLCTRSGT